MLNHLEYSVLSILQIGQTKSETQVSLCTLLFLWEFLPSVSILHLFLSCSNFTFLCGGCSKGTIGISPVPTLGTLFFWVCTPSPPWAPPLFWVCPPSPPWAPPLFWVCLLSPLWAPPLFWVCPLSPLVEGIGFVGGWFVGGWFVGGWFVGGWFVGGWFVGGWFGGLVRGGGYCT